MELTNAGDSRPMVALAAYVESTPELCKLLSGCATSTGQNEFVSRCQSFLDSQSLEYEQLFAQLGDTLAQGTEARYPAASPAWKSYQKNRRLKKKERAKLKEELGLDLAPADREREPVGSNPLL
jgi:hypothetical protein